MWFASFWYIFCLFSATALIVGASIFKSAFLGQSMDQFKTAADTLFVLLDAIMILAMHAGFAFLELGTVRRKNQVNALVKILADFAVSTIAYFFVGYAVAYGTGFMVGAETLAAKSG
jgi:ammonium transporter, Amt family